MNCFSCTWPLGGVQQQNGPNNNLILKGTFLSFYLVFFLHFLPVLFSSASRPCPRQMADAGGQPQLTQVTSDSNTFSVKTVFLIFTCLFKYAQMWLDLKNR